MLGLGPLEIIIIALVILALFGYKKLPDAARAIGRSARIFKAETKGLRDDPAPRDLESKAEAQYVRDAARRPPPRRRRRPRHRRLRRRRPRPPRPPLPRPPRRRRAPSPSAAPAARPPRRRRPRRPRRRSRRTPSTR